MSNQNKIRFLLHYTMCKTVSGGGWNGHHFKKNAIDFLTNFCALRVHVYSEQNYIPIQANLNYRTCKTVYGGGGGAVEGGGGGWNGKYLNTPIPSALH